MTRRLCALVLLLCCFGTPLYAGTSDTAEPVPGPPFSANATFLTDLQTFLRFEDAARFSEQFQPFIVTGCLGPTSLTLTHTPSACLGYPGGLRTKEVGSISYLNNATCYTILHRDTVGSVTGPGGILYTRVPSTHYAVNCTAPALPTTPADSVMLMKVTTVAGAITAVTDIRQLSPINTQTAAACSVSSATCVPAGSCAAGPCCLPTAGVCDAAVTNPKLGDSAVSTAKLLPGATSRGLTEDSGWNAPAIPAGETLLHTMALTAHGGPVIFLLQGAGSVTTGALVMKLKLDGTTLSEADLGVGGTALGAEMTAVRISITVAPGAHSVTVTGACPAGGVCAFLDHVLAAFESG